MKIERLTGRSDRFYISIFILASIVVRLFAIFIVHYYAPARVQQMFFELYENGLIAKNILAGSGFSGVFLKSMPLQPTSYMAPFYPYFLAFFFFIFGKSEPAPLMLLSINLVQTIVLSLSIYPIFILSKKIFNKEVAIISSLMFIFYPDFILPAIQIHQISFLIAFISFTMYALLRLKDEKNSSKWATIVGGLLGISMYIDPAVMSLLPFTILWIFLSFKTSSKRKAKDVLVLTISFLIVVSPWLIRNYIIYNSILFRVYGYNLWRGNNPYFTETSIPQGTFPKEVKDLKSEYEVHLALRDYALGYMISHPLITAKNFFIKFYHFWWFPKILPEQSPPIRKIIYLPFLILGIIGLMKSTKLNGVSLLWIPLISFSLLYSVFFALPRYRLPIEIYLFIFSSYTIHEISRNLKGRTSGIVKNF